MTNITKVSTTVFLSALLFGVVFSTINLTTANISPAYGQAALTDLKCYSTNDETDPARVRLTDQFGTEFVDAGPFPFLCTSAIKNDPTGTPQLLHWNAYPVFTGEGDEIDPPPIILTDQFGSMNVDPGTVIGGFLMAPVVKNGEGDLKAPHFKCYVVAGTINPSEVTLTDQFGTELNDPGFAVDFCTPAIKTLEDGTSFGTLDAPHFICYTISGEPVDRTVSVEDQFGTRTVTVGFPVVLYTLAEKRFKIDAEKFYTNTNVEVDRIPECIKDADGIATETAGTSADVEVQMGDPLTSFPDFGGTGLDWFDQDGDGVFGCGTDDDLHIEDPTSGFCSTADRDAVHDDNADFQDCVVLDLNGNLVDGDTVDCDVEIGFNFAGLPDCPDPTLKFHDLSGDGFWQPGEDIVNDENGDGVFGRERTVGEASLGDPLPIDDETGKFLLEAVIKKKDGTVSSYNPGQYYAFTKVNVNEDLDTLWIVELFAECIDTNISRVNPDKVPGGAIVILIRGGIVFDLSSDMAAAGTLFLTDNNPPDGVTDNAEAHLEDLEAGDMVLFGVKFGPGLKGMVFPPVDPMCHNEEKVTAEFEGGSFETVVGADLIVRPKA